MSTKVEVHDVIAELGESEAEGELATAWVRVGDFVEQHQVLIEIDAGKVTLELVAPVAGRVLEVAPIGTIARGAVAARIEEIADPMKAATLREATKVRHELAAKKAAAAQAAAKKDAAKSAAASKSLLRAADVARDIDLASLDARIASLSSLAHAEAAVHLVRVARALVVAPALALGAPPTLAYVSVRAGTETRWVCSVPLDADETGVLDLGETPPVPDLVLVRFHDTVERSGFTAANAAMSKAIVLCAPRLVPVLEPSGAIGLAKRCELSVKLGQAPGLVARVLGALAEQLERP